MGLQSFCCSLLKEMRTRPDEDLMLPARPKSESYRDAKREVSEDCLNFKMLPYTKLLKKR